MNAVLTSTNFKKIIVQKSAVWGQVLKKEHWARVYYLPYEQALIQEFKSKEGYSQGSGVIELHIRTYIIIHAYLHIYSATT